MARVAMGDVWDDTKAFVTREAALILPLAFATLGLGTLIWALGFPALPPLDVQGRAEPATAAAWLGKAMIVGVPVGLLVLWANLALSMLVLRPGGTVGEALAGGLRRLPGGILMSLIIGAVVAAVTAVAAIILVVAANATTAASVLPALIMPIVLWASARLVPALPLLASDAPTLAVWAKLQAAFALTRGAAGRIAAVLLIFLIGSTLVSAALQFALGSIFLLIGRALGVPAVGATLVMLLVVILTTVLQSVWIVFQAMLYRRLSAR